MKNQTPFDRLLHASSGLFVKKGHPNNTPEALGKLRFLAVSCYFGVAFITSLLIFSNLPRHDVIDVASDFALLSIIGVLVILARLGGYYQLVFNITVAMLVIILPIGYFSDTAARSLFLIPVALLYAYFLLGKSGGLRWTGIIYIINGAVVAIDHYHIARLGIDTSYIFNGSAALFFISLMLYTFENNNEINQQLIRDQAEQLSHANKTLQEELQSRVDLTLKLQKTVHEIEENNTVLEQSKRALLNVLEDSNELQQQLTQEKADVEEKIELRTRQLQEEQARLHASIDTLNVGFLMTLKSSKSILHNPALLAICGLDEDVEDSRLLEILSKKLKMTFALRQAIRQCQMSGESFTASDIVVDGKYIRILGSAIRITEDTDPIGVVLLIEDMSEAKLLERSKDEFVSIASHELRTPLTAIRGNLSLLRLMHGEKFVDKEVKQMMDDTSDSVIRLISIVNQFLTTSRLEQKKTVFEFTSVDIAEVITSVTNNLRAIAEESGLTLKLSLSKDIPNVKADAGRLQGVLNNLIGNAIKYTEKGTVTVSAEQTKGSVTVRIADTGRGIDTKNQQMLFQKFQQATDNIFTRDDSRSTGLGLYITKLMVEQMNGTIRLEKSVPGKGSVFSFTLPVA